MLMSPVVVAGLLSVAVSMLDHTNSTSVKGRGDVRWAVVWGGGWGVTCTVSFPAAILGDPSYMLFYLTPAIQPRMLVTFNADLEPLAVTVRVGQVGVWVWVVVVMLNVSSLQAVDVVGQAGKPKTITGFQTHTTPVLLAYGERAELATEECILAVGVVRG